MVREERTAYHLPNTRPSSGTANKNTRCYTTSHKDYHYSQEEILKSDIKQISLHLQIHCAQIQLKWHTASNHQHDPLNSQ